MQERQYQSFHWHFMTLMAILNSLLASYGNDVNMEVKALL